MATEEEITFYNEIIDKGCCKRCALRYLGFCKTLISFEYPTTSLVNFGFLSPMEEFMVEPPSKKRKTDPCVVCLDLLQDEVLDEMLSCKDVAKATEYKHEGFNAYISFPICTLIRDRSMSLHLKKKFPEHFKDKRILEIKHTWRLSVEDRLTKLLKKTYVPKDAALNLHFNTHYELDQEEVQFFAKSDTELGRRHIIALLQSISDEEFSNLVNVPPKVPLYSVKFTNVKLSTEPIHLIGSYYKYSRDLHQNVNEGSDTIASYIITAIRSVTGDCTEMIFKSSGHEDPNVRVLAGRTFHVQLDEPKIETISQFQCREIEKLIRRNKHLAVKNLRQELKRDIYLAIRSEETTPRSYKILCLIQDCNNVDRGVNAINMYTKMMVRQQTPIRVIHQRLYRKNKATIYYIRAKKVKESLIELDLCADTSLHVPEFINGDWGRTSPSISEIIKAKAECLAMDIVGFQSTLACAIEEEEVVI